MGETLWSYMIVLILVMLAGLLWLIFGRRKPKYPQMVQCAASQFSMFFMYAIAVMIAAFGVFVFIVTSADEDSQDGAGVIMLIVYAILLILTAVFIIMGRMLGQRYVYFDEDKLIVGIPFGADLTIAWREIGEVRPIGRDGTAVRLYDRDGDECLIANTSMDNYYQFYETAMRKVYGGVQEGPMTPGRR